MVVAQPRYRVVATPATAALLVVMLTVSAANGPPPAQAEDTRPNILLIVTDDQRLDSMGAMPITQARIFDAGINFSNAFVTTPMCCPSRSSILTGMYAANHGVRSNSTPLTVPTFVTQLDDAGYYTGMFGKYLNSQDGSPLPEFDDWARVKEKSYVDPVINVNGTRSVHAGYSTYIIRDLAQDFLAQAALESGPFMMLFAPKASHEPNTPAPGDEGLFPDLAPLRPPSHNEADISDKPNWANSSPLLTTAQIQSLDDQRRRMWQTLHAVDLSIDSLLDTLEAQGELDNTLVVFISDNGYLLGEHRLTAKTVLYEESVRVPFAVRYDPLVSAGRVDTRLVANIDIAPTIYELAGIPVPSEVDGRSLVPLLRAESGSWRDDLLLEGPRAEPALAAHTGDWVYAEREGEIPELYDLGSDPFQLNNLSQDAQHDAKEAEMKARLDAYSGHQ